MQVGEVIEKLEDWKIVELQVGKLQVGAVGRLGDWKIERLED